ncbi:Diadenosine tetraphosphatase and related serine/threonine protein phosphatases [Halomonas citrativorans]|uniref:Diadenosine tetraphosphatase and related serine/threonine protein phosphatases n=1 Tax=Halomonas citrativorans TaxID=2742612 RepID=A0A1R4I583_9GAMM|nr:metallophosphoesterase [Halomonas citrativorans]SJN14990.1 Diadenosine tetraphosphatase and related serine/threonine protein phosphatases [Halomonas citrativorans]
MAGYDLIGDVHGCGATLITLLETLGYREQRGVYRHPQRKVIFLGDLIDRGPRIRLAVTVARRMVEEGEAYIVMGNHEHSALAYMHPAPPGSHKRWLREHTPRHNRIMENTLAQYQDYTNEWDDTLAWFKTLPLFLEIDGIRVVHACWDDGLIEQLKKRLPDGRMDTRFLIESTDPGTQAYRIIDRLTRGANIPLPGGIAIHSGDGYTRQSFRAHFWAANPTRWGDVVFQPDNLPGDLETRLLTENERQRLSYYGPEQPPLFIGHYWCEGIPALPAPNIACLDYSAVKYGCLVAYRWDGETQLNADNFVWVQVIKEERSNANLYGNDCC